MIRVLLIFTILITTNLTSAQTTIQGIIKEVDGTTLPGANIYFDQTQIGTTSDLDGKFEIITKLTGSPNLIVDFIGFKSFAQSISLDQETIFVEIILKPSFNQLEAVTITAGAFEASDKKKSVALKPLDIVTTAGALGDVSGALQTLPGVTTVGESGRLFVRGGDDTETQTFIDGMLVPIAYTSGAPNLSVRGRFNPFIFSGTVFSVGAYSAEYGQALSSVLQLNTKELPEENKIDLSLMNIGGSAAITQLWKEGAVTATLDYINLAPYTEVITQNVNWIKPPESIDGEVSLRQKTKRNGMLKLYGKFGQSSLKLNSIDLDAPQGFSPFDIQNENLFLNTNWKSIIGNKWSVKTGASYTKNIDNIRLTDFDVKENLETGFFKLVMNNYSSDRVTVKFGSEALVQSISETIRIDTVSLSNNFKENRYSGFAEAEVYLSTKIAMRVGGRLEQSTIKHQTTIAPRFSTAYKLNDNSQLSIAYGQFYQQASKNILLKTREVSEQRADHYILNYQVNKKKRLFRAETYYKNYARLITYNSNLSAVANDGNGYAYGLDVFYKDLRTIENAQFWISYSYLNTKRKYQDYPVQAIPSFASKHSISVVYKHWMNNWNSLISCTAKYSTPRTYDDPNRMMFNDRYTKPYRSLDFSWSYLPKQHIIFYGAVTNVLGFNNQFGFQFSSQADGNGVYAQQEILPSAKRFFFVGCFLTFTKKGGANQLDTLN